MFANRLSDQEGLSRCYSGSGNNMRWNRACTGYRLPTEAEWEYAARGGEDWVYPGSFDAGVAAWYSGNSEEKTHPVGKKKPNAWGLYDMSGNVREWVWDWYGSYSGDARDPTGPEQGSNRVVRGGSWLSKARRVRVAYRSNDVPGAPRQLRRRVSPCEDGAVGHPRRCSYPRRRRFRSDLSLSCEQPHR